MKKKISRILGVVLTLVLLSSFFIASAPASAGTQAWTTFATPSGTGLVLDAGNTWTGPFAITSDGSAIYAGSNVGGAGNGALVKSTDGGRTWTNTGLVPAYTGASPTITDIVVSSIDDNIVYVTDGYDIYKTTDGGTTWVTLSNLFTSGVGTANAIITSIDVGYLGTNPYIFAATSGFGGFGPPAIGGAYVAQEAVFGMPWSDLLLDTDRAAPWGATGTDVNVILVDPVNFATTQMVMAVATDYSAATVAKITTKYAGAQWGSTVGDVTLVATPAAIASPLWSASVWLPDDFSSSLATGNMQAFVGVAPMTAAQGDVFWALFAAGPSNAFDLNVNGAAIGTAVTGLDGIGSAASASMLASGYSSAATTTPAVYRTNNSGATWAANIKRPTGGASPLQGTALSSVLMLDASNAIVGTHGIDCGVHVTSDGGAVWNGVSLLNTAVNSIDDLDFRADGTIFMATDMTGGDSIWRYASNWERVYSETLLGIGMNPELVQSSPDGTAVFMADQDGPYNLYRSLDDGQTWAAQVTAAAGAIPSWVVLDANTVLVGGTNVVYQTTNNGVIWFSRAVAGAGVVQSFDVASNGDIIAGAAAKVARSQDNGTSWSTIAQPAGNTTTLVAASDAYATTSEVFATGTAAGDAGVWSWTWGTSSAWTRIDGGGNTVDVNAGTGIVTAPGGPDGMVYVADGSAAGEGVTRIKGNRTVAEQMADAGNTFTGLWYQPGSNVLYTIAGTTIRTYTDTLAVAGSGVAVSAITTGTATATWAALANAATYLVVVNTTAQTNFYTAANSAGVVVAINNATQTATITGLAANTAYNVSVWAATPVSSYLFDDAATSFTTTAAVPVAPPANLLPVNGAINVPINDVAFGWAAPTGGAVSYNWELTTDPTFTVITEGSANTVLTLLVWAGPLDYDTSYYWRVNSVGASGVPSAWVTSVFTTVAEPQPPVTVEPPPTPTITLPPITIPPPATPIITLPPPQVTVVPPDVTVVPPDVIVDIPPQEPPTIVLPEEEAPMYIWAIVAIGAILTIAVIVLIVRTRRVV